MLTIGKLYENQTRLLFHEIPMECKTAKDYFLWTAILRDVPPPAQAFQGIFMILDSWQAPNDNSFREHYLVLHNQKIFGLRFYYDNVDTFVKEVIA